MEIINRQAQKVVAVAYRRWSFTGGSTVGFDWEMLVFWIGGRLLEVVAYGRWSTWKLASKLFPRWYMLRLSPLKKRLLGKSRWYCTDSTQFQFSNAQNLISTNFKTI